MNQILFFLITDVEISGSHIQGVDVNSPLPIIAVEVLVLLNT